MFKKDNNINIDDNLKDVKTKLLDLENRQRVEDRQIIKNNFNISNNRGEYSLLCKHIMSKYEIGELEKYFDVFTGKDKIVLSLYKFEAEEVYFDDRRGSRYYNEGKRTKYCIFLKIIIYKNNMTFNFKGHDYNIVGDGRQMSKSKPELNLEDMQKIFEIIQLVKNYAMK